MNSRTNNSMPTNLTVILDIDSTLACTSENDDFVTQLNITNDPNLIDIRKRIYTLTTDDIGERGRGEYYTMSGIKRPHLDEFIDFCFSYFKIVGVWSAGKRSYVEHIVPELFGNHEPHIIYTLDDCERNSRGVYKPLEKIVNDERIKRFTSMEKILIIDDNEDTFSMNVDNAIHIPKYEPAFTVNSLRTDDRALLDIMEWLNDIRSINYKDIRNLDKTQIFRI